MGHLPVTIKLVKTHSSAVLPTRGSSGAVGFDLYSVEPVILGPLQRMLVNTGWKISVPTGYEGQVRPRSGLAYKLGVTVLNSPGTLDYDYVGPLGVVLINLSNELISLPAGSRVAQLVIKPVELYVKMTEVSEFTGATERGENGFGSTGV